MTPCISLGQTGKFHANSLFIREFVEELKNRGWEFYLRSFRYGACVPSTCSQQEVEEVANAMAQTVNFNAMVPVCEHKGPEKPLNRAQIIILSVLCTFIFLGVVSTIGDIIRRKNVNYFPKERKGFPVNIIQCFSISRNCERALTPPREYPATEYLNGLKVVSIIWVFFNHASLILFFSLHINDQDRLINYSKGFAEQIFNNGLVAIEIFFFMTSFIMTYLYLSPKNMGKKPGIVQEFIIPLFKRALKLLLVTLLATAIIMILTTYASGPMFTLMAAGYESLCINRWWVILFFGTNFENVDQSCVTASWYVSADIQLYIVLLIYVYLYKRRRNAAHILLVSMMVLSIISTAIIQLFRNNPPTMLVRGIDIPNWAQYFSDTHYPQDHFFAYGSGIALGTLLSKRLNYVLPTWKKLLGWTISLSISAYVLFSTIPWFNGVEFTALESMLYTCLQKPLFSASIFWLCFVCTTGNGGFINKFLSSKIFAMLGKLVLMIFLTNLTVITLLIEEMDALLSSKKIYLVGFVVQAIFINCLLAAFLHVLFELPLTELLGLVMGAGGGEARENRKPEETKRRVEESEPQLHTLTKLNTRHMSV